MSRDKKAKFVVAVGGPKGSGKTAILEKVVSLLKNCDLISTGKILQELSKTGYDRDFVALPKEEKYTIREQVVTKILNKEENLLLDLHFGEFENEGYPCVITYKLLRHITHFILIIADANSIQKRRQADNKKRRIDIPSIKLNILGEKLLFKELTKDFSVKNLLIVNEDLNESARTLLNFLLKND